jgi:hypothetical protein
MMIRSAPPASIHFAEMPVPAPAPMMGRPAWLVCRRFWRTFWREVGGGMIIWWEQAVREDHEVFDAVSCDFGEVPHIVIVQHEGFYLL